jgi:hypothetical protein
VSAGSQQSSPAPPLLRPLLAAGTPLLFGLVCSAVDHAAGQRRSLGLASQLAFSFGLKVLTRRATLLIQASKGLNAADATFAVANGRGPTGCKLRRSRGLLSRRLGLRSALTAPLEVGLTSGGLGRLHSSLLRIQV